MALWQILDLSANYTLYKSTKINPHMRIHISLCVQSYHSYTYGSRKQGSSSPMLGIHKFLYTWCPLIQLSHAATTNRTGHWIISVLHISMSRPHICWSCISPNLNPPTAPGKRSKYSGYTVCDTYCCFTTIVAHCPHCLSPVCEGAPAYITDGRF